MTAREELIKEIEEMGDDSGRIYEFILADRKRIVGPLVEAKKRVLKYSGLIGWVTLTDTLIKPIDETLKLAGEL